MNADPKPAARIVDPSAARVALLRERECVACGVPSANAHHVLPRSEGGDDVLGNLVALCGSGTSGCHGAWHGSPYTVQVGNWCLDVERRDRAWVAERVGNHLVWDRLDVVFYLYDKLGTDAAVAYLERVYCVTIDDLFTAAIRIFADTINEKRRQRNV